MYVNIPKCCVAEFCGNTKTIMLVVPFWLKLKVIADRKMFCKCTCCCKTSMSYSWNNHKIERDNVVMLGINWAGALKFFGTVAFYTFNFELEIYHGK